MVIKVNPDVAKELPTDQVVALALFGDLVNNHADKISKLLHSHDEPTDKDPYNNVIKLAALSQERGRFFDEDLIKVGEEAHYFDLAGAIDSIKNVFQGAKKAVINAYVPGAGDIAEQHEQKQKGKLGAFLSTIFSKLGKQGTNGIGDNNPDAVKLKEELSKKKDEETKKKGMILGMKKKTFFIGLSVIVVLGVVLIVVIKMRKKQKAVKE